MPLQATSGAASYDAFGGGAAAVPQYIEDVFSTYLYTGNGTSQTITNGIDLSTKGGLVWIKCRGSALGHRLVDTARGTTYSLSSNTDTIQVQESTGLTAFGTTGFTIGADADYNTNNTTFASWTFQKKAKFFDVVTYTGNGVAGRQISHSLGSEVGCIIIKTLSVVGTGWPVWHRGISTQGAQLNATGAFESAYYSAWVDSTQPTSSVFTVGSDAGVNSNGETYVAYLFAHNAGGFGLTGTDNVISCGSFTTDGSGNFSVNLGYEPQWVLFKATDVALGWNLYDNMRGMPASSGYVSSQRLAPQSAGAESTQSSPNGIGVSSTGFSGNPASNSTNFIYIAIRRGPMKVPTSGTSVYAAQLTADPNAILTGLEAPDTIISRIRQSTNATWNHAFADRLRGDNFRVVSTNALAENSFADTFVFTSGKYATSAITAADMVYWTFKRAPSFYDVVCYTGTGSNTTVTHNLKAVPELIICKRRDTTGDWDTYCSALANTEYLVVNTTAAKATGATRWNSTTPTSSVFSVGTSTTTNASAGTYVARLFATCAGVSKVGSYTGTATTLQVDCGFTSGARFVLIKRTDSTGAWYLWDSARGIIAGNDPYILLNSTAVEVTNTDYIDTYSAGFELSSTAPADINASGGTYIFLAIA
jgi:hypothetical protein